MDFKRNKKYNKELKKLFKIDNDLKKELKIVECKKESYLKGIDLLYNLHYYNFKNIDSMILFDDLTKNIESKNKFEVEDSYNKLYEYYFNYLIVKIYKTL